ncbi:hypothetical protein [Streptomyces sp. NPDC059575]|uniref:hypothetical protein n=1 Tax=Streptomyces sp. NPDC059575 TaxID=3346872 RepID=UPI0036C54214
MAAPGREVERECRVGPGDLDGGAGRHLAQDAGQQQPRALLEAEGAEVGRGRVGGHGR